MLKSEDTNINSELKNISSNFLYQYLKDNFFSIIHDLNIFNKLKFFLIEEALPLMNNFLKKSIKFLSRCLSLIMIMNLQINKDDLIDFILNFAEQSNSNIYISLLILRNYLDELERILDLEKNTNLLDETSLKFTEKIPILVNFVIHAINIFHFNPQANNFLTNFEFKEFEGNSDIVEIALDFILSWKMLKLQFLKNSNLFEFLIKLFNPKYCEKISFIFCDQIKKFESSYSHCDNFNQPIENLLKIIWENIEEVNIIKSLVLFFDEYLTNEISIEILNDLKFSEKINSKYNYEETVELVSAIANIVSDAMESYTILLITKNDLNICLTNFIKLILTCKNRRINSRIFPVISEISNLLKEIEYENLSKEDFCYLISDSNTEIDLKNYFSNMLIEYMSFIMLQCKLNQIYIPALDKEIPLENCMEIQLHEKNDENIIIEKFVSTQEYRIRAEEVYYDIFSFFIHVMEENGAKIIFDFLGKIIEMHNINCILNQEIQISEEEKNDKSNNIEVIIHMLTSVNDCFFSVCGFDYSIYITDISLKIFKTQIVHNKSVLVSFISLLDKISLVIDRNPELKYLTVEILLLSLCDKKFENISSNIIARIIEYLNQKDEKLFFTLQQIFLQNFKVYEKNTIFNLTEALIDSFYFPKNRKSGKLIPLEESDKEIFEKFSLILTPVEFLLKELDQFLQNKSKLNTGNLNDFKNFSRKIFLVYFKLLEKTINSKSHSYYILSNFYGNCNKLIDFIFINLYEDEEMLKDIFKIYEIIFTQNLKNENLDENILTVLCSNLTNVLIELFNKNDKTDLVFRLLLKIFENSKFLNDKEKFEIFEFFKKLILIVHKEKYFSDLDFRDYNLDFYMDIVIIILNSEFLLDNFYLENLDILSNYLFEILFLENNSKLDDKILEYFGYLIKKINKIVNENYLESLISKVIEKIFMRFELINSFTKVNYLFYFRSRNYFSLFL